MPIYMGIDWSHTHPDACFLNAHGQVLSRLTVPHSAEGLAALDASREPLGVSRAACRVGLETAHSIVIDFLWECEYPHIFVIPPGAVNPHCGARRRYRQTNAHTDETDAWVIADMLRTDPNQLRPWHPDSELLRQMRAKVSLLRYLTQEITRLGNRLPAVLARYYPAALHIFHDPISPINLHFLQAFPTPQAAVTLTRETFTHFARAHRYRQSDTVLTACFARLQAAYPIASAATVAALHDEASWLARHLLTSVEQKHAELHALQALFQQHPDHALFASFPGVGDFLAPALLVKFGDTCTPCSNGA